MKKIMVLLLACALTLSAFGCGGAKQGSVEYGADTQSRTAASVRADKKNEVVRYGTGGNMSLTGVSEAESSSKVANEKFELDVDLSFEGNPYDPDEVNVYGQFVSPNDEVYTMPAFYYADFDRSFEALDESADFSMDGYVEQGDVTLKGKISEINGVKQPVAKAQFDSAAGVYTNAGAILNVGGVTRLHDSISVWLKKDADLKADALYLCFYQAKGEAYIQLPALTETWKKYTFRWSDFTPNNTDGSSELLALNTMYSGYIQTRGAEARGGVWISDLRSEREGFDTNYAVLSDFVSSELKNYHSGELNGTEVITAKEDKGFKLRFRFGETGEWLYRVVVEENGEKRASYTSSATITENADEEKNRGLLRVEPTQKRNFVFEDGTPYVPIGQNVAYSVDPKRGSYDYDVFFPKMKAAGMNFCRVWLTYIGYGIQSTEGGILGFDNRQDRAFIFDYIVEQAAEYDFYLQIPLMTFSRFHSESATDDVEWRSWDSSPYNVINGGYLDEAHEFYTDARAKEDTKKLYRYYVARWGYSRNILNWEIMNEIGESSDYDQTKAKAWAEEIGGYMHAVDPFDHLVSLSSVNFFDEVYGASSLDFVSIHSYIWGAEYAVNSADVTKQVWEHFRKPVIIGEIGASSVSEEDNYYMDKTGLVMRQTAFTAPMSGSAGGGMLWWWKQINAYDFYGNVTPAIEYFKLLPDDFVKMDSLDYEDYVFSHANQSLASKGRVLGFISDTAVYAYLFDTRYNYGNPNPGAIENSALSFSLSDGEYEVKVFDTQNGGVTKTFSAQAKNGKLELALDAWSRDTAFIIVKK